MTTRSLAAFLAPCLLALTVACDDRATDPIDEGITTRELAELALQTDDLVDLMLGSQLGSMGDAGVAAPPADLITTDASFTRTRTCPAGGEVVTVAEVHRERDTDTGVMEAEFAGNRTRTDCAFMRDGLTVTVNGVADFEAFRRRVAGAFDGLQTSSYVGSFVAVRSDGEERSCDFDVVVVRDPDAHTKTVTGTICGEPVDRTKDWNPTG